MSVLINLKSIRLLWKLQRKGEVGIRDKAIDLRVFKEAFKKIILKSCLN